MKIAIRAHNKEEKRGNNTVMNENSQESTMKSAYMTMRHELDRG